MDTLNVIFSTFHTVDMTDNIDIPYEKRKELCPICKTFVPAPELKREYLKLKLKPSRPNKLQ